MSTTSITTKGDEQMLMHTPPHPGEVLKELYLAPLKLTVTRVAEALRVPRKTVSSLLNGRLRMTPPMAVRLSVALNTSPELWMNLQQQYDLWIAMQNEELRKVDKLIAA